MADIRVKRQPIFPVSANRELGFPSAVTAKSLQVRFMGFGGTKVESGQDVESLVVELFCPSDDRHESIVAKTGPVGRTSVECSSRPCRKPWVGGVGQLLRLVHFPENDGRGFASAAGG